MKKSRRMHPSLASILLVTGASIILNTNPLQAQRAGAQYYDTLFVNAPTWGLSGRDDLPVLRTTPPWERVWETPNPFFPRIRLSDADGRVWEAVLNPHAVQAIIVAQDSVTLQERVDSLFEGKYTTTWLNLLDFLRTAQVEIRGFVPEDNEDLSHETWTANVREFVRYFPFSDSISVREAPSVIAPGYALGNIWPAQVHDIDGFWVDYLVKVTHSIYRVEGHNPPEDDCIKLSSCMLFCDGKRRY